MRQEIIFQIRYSEVESLYGKEELISVHETKTRPYELNPQTHSIVTIVLDLNKKITVRKHYTVLDLFSNLGGLSFAALIIVSLSYMILQLNVFENWMVHELFRGDFDLQEIQYKNYQVNMAKYAVGKELKPHKLTLCGQILEALYCRKCTWCE